MRHFIDHLTTFSCTFDKVKFQQVVCKFTFGLYLNGCKGGAEGVALKLDAGHPSTHPCVPIGGSVYALI